VKGFESIDTSFTGFVGGLIVKYGLIGAFCTPVGKGETRDSMRAEAVGEKKERACHFTSCNPEHTCGFGREDILLENRTHSYSCRKGKGMSTAKDDEFTGGGSKRVEDVCRGEEGGKKFADDLLVLHGQIGNVNFEMMGTGVDTGFVSVTDGERSHFER
jgi:hypothetical protein